MICSVKILTKVNILYPCQQYWFVLLAKRAWATRIGAQGEMIRFETSG